MDRPVRFGVEIPALPPSEIVRLSVLGEKVGFDTVWWTDHFMGGPPDSPLPELFTVMAIMGHETEKVGVGCAVTDIRRRHPATIAQTVTTLDDMSRGRTILGLGAGEATNLFPAGISSKNMQSRLREGIQIIKMLWAADHEHPANFRGKFYSLNNAYLQVKPAQKPAPTDFRCGLRPQHARARWRARRWLDSFRSHTGDLRLGPQYFEGQLEKIWQELGWIRFRLRPECDCLNGSGNCEEGHLTDWKNWSCNHAAAVRAASG